MTNTKLSRLALLLSGLLAIIAIGVTAWRARTPAAPAAATVAPHENAAQLIAGLENRLRANPNDAAGWRNLGWSFFQSERFAEAASAYQKAAALKPEDAALWSSLGEALTLAGSGNVPPDAQTAFKRALTLAPKDPRARYFLAVADDIAGRHARAIDGWLAILADSSPADPWYDSVRRAIEQVAAKNRIDVRSRLAALPAALPATSPAAAAIPGPTPAQMRAASGLAPGQQQAMVDGMVQSLAGKLGANPRDPAGWIMLMRSYATLGRQSEARAALLRGKAANPQAAADLDAAARTLGIATP